MGTILGLLGVGGGGGGGLSSSNGASSSLGGININNGGGSNTAMYVLIGVGGFIGLVAILVFGRK